MKKVTLLLAVVGLLGFSSCGKTYTCICSDNSQPTVKASSATAANTDCIAKSTGTVTCVY